MKLKKVQEILKAEIIVGEDSLSLSVERGCGSDLMSDVLAYSKSHSLLLTGLVNPQVIRTAEMADISAIVFVRGKMPPQETIALASEKQIPILTTQFSMLESCGKLYTEGLLP